MTLAEGKEIGQLVEALENADELLRDMEAKKSRQYGVGIGFEYSEAGSEGFGTDVIVPRAMALETVRHLRAKLLARLGVLGVAA